MNFLTKAYIRAREASGQTMTEYALIMAAIAVVCIVAYNALGTQISTLINTVEGDL
jgi:Flp pilus assembly pilin Flp